MKVPTKWNEQECLYVKTIQNWLFKQFAGHECLILSLTSHSLINALETNCQCYHLTYLASNYNALKWSWLVEMADLCDCVFSNLATVQFASIPDTPTGSQIPPLFFVSYSGDRQRKLGGLHNWAKENRPSNVNTNSQSYYIFVSKND